MLFYKRSTWWSSFQWMFPEDIFPLLTFIHLCYFSHSLQSLASSCVYLNYVNPVLFVVDLHNEIYSGCGPSDVHIVHGLLSRDSNPMCKKFWLCFSTSLHCCWCYFYYPIMQMDTRRCQNDLLHRFVKLQHLQIWLIRNNILHASHRILT